MDWRVSSPAFSFRVGTTVAASRRTLNVEVIPSFRPGIRGGRAVLSTPFHRLDHVSFVLVLVLVVVIVIGFPSGLDCADEPSEHDYEYEVPKLMKWNT